MLKSLHLKGVGPANELGPIQFSERLNFITGDNGLGKSFILDTAWWVLTRTWARDSVATPRESFKTPSISFEYSKVTAGNKHGEIFFKNGLWPQQKRDLQSLA